MNNLPSDGAAPADAAPRGDAESPNGDASGDDDHDASADAGPGCPEGSALVATRTTCAAAATDSTVTSALAAAASGAVVTVGDTASLPCVGVRVCVPDAAPPLVFSDSPESPTADGILYADAFAASNVRMYVYHVNGGTSARKFSIVALNQGTTDAHVTLTKRGAADPTTRYVQAGVQAAARYLADSSHTVVTVPAGKRVVVDEALDALRPTNGQLVHEIVDLGLDAAMKLSVVTVAASADAAAATATLNVLAADTDHQRGTFPKAERIVIATSPLASGVMQLALGDGTTEDILIGTDAVDGASHPSLSGNYGLVYRARFSAAAPSAFAVAPRGGAWGGAGAFVQKNVSTPFALGSTTPIPANGSAGVVAQAAAGPFEIDLISAGGSSLPVALVVASPP